MASARGTAYIAAAAALGRVGAPGMCAVPAALAMMNLRHGRGDRPGAMRLGAVVFGAVLAKHLIGMHYTLALGPMWFAVMVAIAKASAFAILAWFCNIAVEPIIRRQRPATIVSWTRLLSGKWRDPLVARALLPGGATRGLPPAGV